MPRQQKLLHRSKTWWRRRKLDNRDWEGTKWLAQRLLFRTRLALWNDFVKEEGHAPRAESTPTSWLLTPPVLHGIQSEKALKGQPTCIRSFSGFPAVTLKENP